MSWVSNEVLMGYRMAQVVALCEQEQEARQSFHTPVDAGVIKQLLLPNLISDPIGQTVPSFEVEALDEAIDLVFDDLEMEQVD